MKNILKVIVISGIILLVCGCNRNGQMDDVLDRAESIVDIYPDSVILILRQNPVGPSIRKSTLARHALLHARALYKGMYEFDSDSLLNIAIDYYEHTDNLAARMHSHLIYGYNLIVNERLSPAILEFVKAEECAVALKDSFNLGMIHRYMALLYNRAGRNKDELKYSRLAVSELMAVADFSYTGEALLELSSAEQNSGNYDEALEIIKGVRDSSVITGDSLLWLESVKMQAYAEYASGKLEDAHRNLKLYLIDPKSQPSEKDLVNAMDISVALDNRDYVGWLRDVYYTDEQNKLIVPSSYWVLKGDYKTAYESANAYGMYVDSMYNEMLNQNMTQVINEYHGQKAETALKSVRKSRLIYSVLSLVSVLLLGGCIFYISHSARKARQRRDDMIAAARTLLKDLETSVIRSGVSFVESQMTELDHLCESYFACQDNENAMSVVVRKVGDIVEQLSTDSDFYKSMADQLDYANADVITRFRNQIRGLKDIDIRLFTYKVANFSIPSICLLLKCDHKSVYNRTYRLKKKVECVKER